MDKPSAQPPPFNSPPPDTHTHLVLYVVLVVLFALVGAGIGLVIHKRTAAAAATAAAARAGQPPVPVALAKVIQKNVPIYLDGLGTVQAFQAFNIVTVHAQVSGQLNKIAYVEGQDVHAGDLLAQIDPRPFQTALEQAQAKKGEDAAQLANARVDLDRETALLAAQIDSQQVYDTQKALVDQLDASVKADQAAIDSANVQLAYCTITSPLDGRTGIRPVDQGNVVSVNDTNGIAVITQLRPISVLFTLPEQNLGEIHRQMQKNPAALKVLAVGRDNTNVLDEGTLAVIDNQIDTTTGTIRIKATFPNENLRLWPGQFVNIRLQLDNRENGIVVPAAVIQRGPEGPDATYAFVVQGEGTNLTVKQQPVAVAQIDGGDALIDSGLQPGQSVVTEGQYRLMEGSKIRPTGSRAGGGSGRGGGSSSAGATNQ